MVFDTFIRMNTGVFRKDMRKCLQTPEFIDYLTYFLANLIDLRNDSECDFFQKMLYCKLLLCGNGVQANHQGVVRVSNSRSGLRISTSCGFLDNKILNQMSPENRRVVFNNRQLLTIGTLVYVPETIVFYAIPEAEKLAQFIEDHRVFFGGVKVEIWAPKKKSK